MGEQLQVRGGRYEFSLQPVTDIHLYSHLENEPGANTDVSYVYILSAMGLFILVIVCINYVNLSTAQFAHRMREIGMRKVLGASRLHLVRQYLGESVLLALAAVLIALLAVWLVSPWFDGLTGMPASAGFMGHVLWWAALPAVAVFIGLLSGVYPAIRLSSFGAIPGLKEGRPFETDRAFSRKLLVVVQFAISIALIIGTGVLFSQISYIRNKPLGFVKEQVIAIPSIAEVAYKYQPWKDDVLRYSGVSAVSQGIYLPGLAGNIGRVTTETAWRVDDPDQVKHDLQGIIVAAGYVETLGMEMLAGRSFSGPLESRAESEKILINETALRVLGWDTPEEALGRQVQLGIGMTQTVIGVVRDFHLRSLHLPIEPLVILYGRGQLMAIRIQPGDTMRTLDYIEEAWARYFPDFPFAFSFIDEDIDRLYQAERSIGYVFAVFALVGVLLACLGLFALVSYTVEQRVREIGIRKALGGFHAPHARHAVCRIRRSRAPRQRPGLAGCLAVHEPLARILRLPNRFGVGNLLRFRGRGPVDHGADHRIPRDPDRIGQSVRSAAQRVRERLEGEAGTCSWCSDPALIVYGRHPAAWAINPCPPRGPFPTPGWPSCGPRRPGAASRSRSRGAPSARAPVRARQRHVRFAGRPHRAFPLRCP